MEDLIPCILLLLINQQEFFLTEHNQLTFQQLPEKRTKMQHPSLASRILLNPAVQCFVSKIYSINQMAPEAKVDLSKFIKVN